MQSGITILNQNRDIDEDDLSLENSKNNDSDSNMSNISSSDSYHRRKLITKAIEDESRPIQVIKYRRETFQLANNMFVFYDKDLEK